MFCAKFGGTWPRDSGQGRFLNFINVFLISLLFPLGKGHGPSFEKKIEFPSPKDALCQIG